MEKTRYIELTPGEFRDRIATAPIAYLPLGTLEWHGEHLPLGSDGIQSSGFFELLAAKVGGIVMPMLFLGPDDVYPVEGKELYGMDFGERQPEAQRYPNAPLAGSAYWVSDEVFHTILRATMKQLSRAGFRIVVGHGHGPSTSHFCKYHDEWLEDFNLETLNCWGSAGDGEGRGVMVDHAAMNETSLVWALRPDLVKMENLPRNPDEWPVGVGGRDPRIHASRKLGEEVIAAQLDRMAGVIAETRERMGV